MAYVGPYILVIDNAAKAAASKVFAIFDQDKNGEGTFSAPLAPTSAGPATKWACGGVLVDGVYNGLKNMTNVQLATYIGQLKAARTDNKPLPTAGEVSTMKSGIRIYDAGQTFDQVLAIEGVVRVQQAI